MLEERIGPSWVSQTVVLYGVFPLQEESCQSKKEQVYLGITELHCRVEFIILIMQFAVSRNTFLKNKYGLFLNNL